MTFSYRWKLHNIWMLAVNFLYAFHFGKTRGLYEKAYLLHVKYPGFTARPWQVLSCLRSPILASWKLCIHFLTTRLCMCIRSDQLFDCARQPASVDMDKFSCDGAWDYSSALVQWRHHLFSILGDPGPTHEIKQSASVINIKRNYSGGA